MGAQRNVDQPMVLPSMSMHFTINNLQYALVNYHWQAQLLLRDRHTQHLQVGSCLFLPTCLTSSTCSAVLCDRDGHYLPSGSCPSPREPLDATPENLYHPFEGHLAFKFADFHFSEQQSSEGDINCILELWAAQVAKHLANDDVPWKSTGDMYMTIDQVQQGSSPWKMTPFRYQGPLPDNPLKWMAQSFKLITHDICSVLHMQITCTDFNGHWNYVPFMEFANDGD
jgi:Plavaka transposase